MAFPIKVCSVCSEKFELKPDKPGFANRCPACSTDESAALDSKENTAGDKLKTTPEQNRARKQAMRDLLYRKE